MPAYNNGDYFARRENPAFKALYKPGQRAPYSGIYRCESCADEIAHNGGNPLPSQNHRQHRDPRQPILWRLIAAAIQAA